MKPGTTTIHSRTNQCSETEDYASVCLTSLEMSSHLLRVQPATRTQLCMVCTTPTYLCHRSDTSMGTMRHIDLL